MPAAADQLFVPALLHHPSLIEHQDQISIHNSLQAVERSALGSFADVVNSSTATPSGSARAARS